MPLPLFHGQRLLSLDVLIDVLTYHAVVDEVLLSTDFNCTGPVAMANGKNSRTVCVDDDIFQKGIGMFDILHLIYSLTRVSVATGATFCLICVSTS